MLGLLGLETAICDIDLICDRCRVENLITDQHLTASSTRLSSAISVLLTPS